MTYQKIIKVLGLLMEASDNLRQKKIKFFCPILDTSHMSCVIHSAQG